MNNRQNYESLVDKYNSGTRVIKKLGMLGMIIQICIIMFINSWKHVGIGHSEIAVPLLFFLSIYFLVKDFTALLRIEGNIARIILEGVALETQNRTNGGVFHGLLKSFNFTNVLIQRSLVNVIALGALGYFMLEFVKGSYPDVSINRWFLSLFVWIPSVIACKLYYDSLKDLDEAKSKAFAK